MKSNVKTLRDKNYEKQLLLRDTNIKMLQQQINPHFLYNTLDTINWTSPPWSVPWGICSALLSTAKKT